MREPGGFRRRSDLLDRLELAGMAIAAATPDTAPREQFQARVERLRSGLEAVDAQLHVAIRRAIQQGDENHLLRQLAHAAVALPPDDGQHYDALDALVSGVLQLGDPGDEALPDEEMVFYQPTPARHVFALLAQAGLQPDDVLVDLGAGLGHVVLLAAIAAGVRGVGIEWRFACVDSARQCAAALQLDGVDFICGDVRDADLSTGTVFYLYTPFRGAMLREVLARLRHEASRRPIRLVALGPCVEALRGEDWLSCDDAESTQPVLFRSRQEHAQGHP